MSTRVAYLPLNCMLGPYLAIGRLKATGYSSGQCKRRSRSLQALWRSSTRCPTSCCTTPLNIALVQGLAAIGRFTEGLALIEETIRQR